MSCICQDGLCIYLQEEGGCVMYQSTGSGCVMYLSVGTLERVHVIYLQYIHILGGRVFFTSEARKIRGSLSVCKKNSKGTSLSLLIKILMTKMIVGEFLVCCYPVWRCHFLHSAALSLDVHKPRPNHN